MNHSTTIVGTLNNHQHHGGGKTTRVNQPHRQQQQQQTEADEETYYHNKSGFSAVSIRSSATSSSARSEKSNHHYHNDRQIRKSASLGATTTNLGLHNQLIGQENMMQGSVGGRSATNTSGRQNLSSYFEVEGDEEVEEHPQLEENGSLNTSQVATASIYSQSTQPVNTTNNSFTTNTSSFQSSKNSKNQHDMNNINILKHFYSESDEESVPEPRIYSPQHNSPQASHSRSVSSKSSKKSNKNTSMTNSQPPTFPMYPNPYQFFPYFNNFPFFPQYPGGSMSPEAIMEIQRLYPNVQASNDTFITDKSLDNSIFFEKEQQFEALVSESKQMKLIIQKQSEMILQISKKLDELSGKLDQINTRETILSHRESIKQSDQKPQKQFNMSGNDLKQNKGDLSTHQLNNSKASNSMINNTSSFHQSHIDTGILKKSPPNSPVKTVFVTNSTESLSTRYSNSIPSISSSPIKPIQKTIPKTSGVNPNSSSLRLSTTSSNNLFGFSSPQVGDHTKHTQRHSHLSSISNLKDYGSPKSSSPSNYADQKKKTTGLDDSLLNSSRLTDSLDLYGDSHEDDSFVYNASCMSSCSSTPPEPFSTDMQRYLHDNILSNAKKEEPAKDSDHTFVKKKDYSNYASSPGIPLKTFSKIDA